MRELQDEAGKIERGMFMEKQDGNKDELRAIVVGATGAVGRDLVEVLRDDPRYTEVRTFTRRPLNIENAKIKAYVVDFEKSGDWQGKVQGDVIFSALGTSRKQAGSKNAQHHVDYDYQMMFARIAHENDVPRMVLVSSVGADAGSSFFYMKLKGEIERDMEKIGFAGLTIVQPPSLVRKHAKRALETISVKAIQSLNAIGLLKKMAPISTKIVAEAMAELGAEDFTGVRRVSGQVIREVKAFA